jgi:hypothetical protein
MHRIIIGFITCWALIGLVGPTANAEKADTVSRLVLKQFMNALKAQDLEEVMKTVDVPWVHKDGVIKERQELKKYFKQLFAARDFSQMTYEIKEFSIIARRQEYRVRLKVKKGGADEFTAMIRYQSGNSKVVGLLEAEKGKRKKE